MTNNQHYTDDTSLLQLATESLAENKALLQHVNQTVDRLATTAIAFSKVVVDARDNMTELESREEGLNALSYQLHKKMDDLHVKTNDYADELGELSTNLEGFYQQYSTHVSQEEERSNEWRQTVSNWEETQKNQLDVLTQTVESFETKLNRFEVQTPLETLQQQVVQLKADWTQSYEEEKRYQHQLTQAMVGMEQVLSQLLDESEQLQQHIQDDNTLQLVASRVESLATRVGVLTESATQSPSNVIPIKEVERP